LKERGNSFRLQILTERMERISEKQVLRPLAEKQGLEPWRHFPA
jgi:hypothetical protein